MCGRINVADHEGLRALLLMMGMQVLPSSPERFNVPPTSTLDVVRSADQTQEPMLSGMRWGFAAATQHANKSNLINARSETVFSKPTFRDWAKSHRAIVPVNGYYEWRRDENGKRQAFYISNAEGPALALAAIFRPARVFDQSADVCNNQLQASSGNQLSFDLDLDDLENTEIDVPEKHHIPEHDVCLLTMAANEQTSTVHHRMPVILDADEALQWISQGDASVLDSYTSATRQPALRLKPVSDYVNNAANDGAACLRLRS